MRNVIDILDLTVGETEDLIGTALDIINEPLKYSESCHGKILANMFFEPSTRTRMSIEAAMDSLGGKVITMNDPATSSASKGETLADTIRVVSSYVDIVAIRHPMEGAALVAAENSVVPVINAGDGGHCHPTQTLADLLTIYREKKRLNNLKIGFCGDLKYGRTVHSLINALTRYEGNSFVLISPDELKLPSYVKNTLKEKNIEYKQTSTMDDAIVDLDVLYMTRIQQERFESRETYERLKDLYILDRVKLSQCRDDMIVMHPLPRINEISKEVDKDPRACYFKQVANGKYIRMALIYKLLNNADADYVVKTTSTKEPRRIVNRIKCSNPRCITQTERGLDQIFDVVDEETGLCRCIYCEQKAKLK